MLLPALRLHHPPISPSDPGHSSPGLARRLPNRFVRLPLVLRRRQPRNENHIHERVVHLHENIERALLVLAELPAAGVDEHESRGQEAGLLPLQLAGGGVVERVAAAEHVVLLQLQGLAVQGYVDLGGERVEGDRGDDVARVVCAGYGAVRLRGGCADGEEGPACGTIGGFVFEERGLPVDFVDLEGVYRYG